MIISLCISIVVLLLVCYWYKRSSNAPPGPRGLPILGMIPFLTRRPEKKFFEWSKKYGPVMSVRIGQRDWIVLNNASSIKEAFLKHGNDTNGRPTSEVLSCEKTGIVLSDDERWKIFRKFGDVTLRNLGVGKSSFEINIMDEIDCLISDVEHRGSEKAYDVRHDISDAIHRIMCVILLGKEAKNEIPKGSYEYLEDPQNAMLFNMATLLPFLRYVPAIAKILREIEISAAMSHEVYIPILSEKEQDSILDNPSTFVGAYAREKKTESENLGRNIHFTKRLFGFYVGDMFVAGIHTTTNAISWCFLGLLHHQRYQERVRWEINKVIGNKKPFIAARNSMPFTMAYLQEILRYCTLTPFGIPHLSKKDVMIGEFKVVKGSQIMSNIWSTHNDPDVFESPEIFRPERFIDKNGNFTPSKYVIPFSVGPRHCMGEQLARIEMFLFFVSIIQRFRIDRDNASDLPGLDDGVLGLVYVPKPYKIILTPL